MKTSSKHFSIIVIVAIISLFLTTCSGKKDLVSGREAPASDFKYGLTEDGKGIKITGYTGKGGALVIPAAIEGIPVQEIANGAFWGSDLLNSLYTSRDKTSVPCDSITSIVIPSSMVDIRGGFIKLPLLTKVTLSDNLKVINGGFADCKNLQTINLPSALEEIHASVFYNCGELNNLIIPSSLTKVKFIGLDGRENSANDAFSGCQKLPIKTRQALQELGYTGKF